METRLFVVNGEGKINVSRIKRDLVERITFPSPANFARANGEANMKPLGGSKTISTIRWVWSKRVHG